MFVNIMIYLIMTNILWKFVCIVICQSLPQLQHILKFTILEPNESIKITWHGLSKFNCFKNLAGI